MNITHQNVKIKRNCPEVSKWCTLSEIIGVVLILIFTYMYKKKKTRNLMLFRDSVIFISMVC